MKTIDQIRKDNLAFLVKSLGSLAKVADAAGTSPSYLSQVKNSLPDSKSGTPKAIGDSLARKLEIGCGKPEGWMDQDHDKDKASENATEYGPIATITPRMAAFINLIESLPESEQNNLMKTLEEKKQHYELLFEELLNRKQG